MERSREHRNPGHTTTERIAFASGKSLAINSTVMSDRSPLYRCRDLAVLINFPQYLR